MTNDPSCHVIGTRKDGCVLLPTLRFCVCGSCMSVSLSYLLNLYRTRGLPDIECRLDSGVMSSRMLSFLGCESMSGSTIETENALLIGGSLEHGLSTKPHVNSNRLVYLVCLEHPDTGEPFCGPFSFGNFARYSLGHSTALQSTLHLQQPHQPTTVDQRAQARQNSVPSANNGQIST